MFLDQVDCAPQGNIVIRVLQYRQDAGGYLKLVPLQTAGIGAVKGVGFRASGATVSLLQPSCCPAPSCCHSSPVQVLFHTGLNEDRPILAHQQGVAHASIPILSQAWAGV